MISTTITIRVRYAETDQMGVVHHTRYFEWFECGRTELMRQLGYPYRTMESEGIMLPIIQTGCQYYSPAKYDDLLQVITELRNIPKAKIHLDYRLLNSETGALLADGFTVHVFINQNGRPIRPHKKFLQVLQPYFNGGTKHGFR